MAQEVFQRYEKKYMLTAAMYHGLLCRLVTKMLPDEYGRHTISNIYFDTPDYKMIRTSIENPEYKEKLRLRAYGRVQDGDTVFIELKKKCRGVVYKRRVPVSLREAKNYLCFGIFPEAGSQILKEIEYVVERYQPRPAAAVSYDRIAFCGKVEPELRVTFDMNIRCRSFALDLREGSGGIPILERENFLMEVKIPGAMPVWMSRWFSELGIFPVSYSKYGTYYKNFILNEQKWGGLSCA